MAASNLVLQRESARWVMLQLVICTKQAGTATALQVNALFLKQCQLARIVFFFFCFFFCCAQRLTETRTNTLRAASTYRPAVLTDPMTSFSSPPPTSSSALLSSHHLQVCLTARVLTHLQHYFLHTEQAICIHFHISQNHVSALTARG